MKNYVHTSDLHQAVHAVVQGKVIIYPTETLYALGCSIRSRLAGAAIMDLKKRPQGKPLPIIIGSMDQLEMVVKKVDPAVYSLSQSFWPGPLSIVLSARKDTILQVQDDSGWTCVRWTSHPVAQKLCLESGMPLVGTSANVAGAEPAAHPRDLDPRLVHRVDCLLSDPPYPRGGLPSTIVRVVGERQIVVLRAGAIGIQRLQAAGWDIGDEGTESGKKS